MENDLQRARAGANEAEYDEVVSQYRTWHRICDLVKAADEKAEFYPSTYHILFIQRRLPKNPFLDDFIQWCIAFDKHAILDLYLETFELPEKLDLAKGADLASNAPPPPSI